MRRRHVIVVAVVVAMAAVVLFLVVARERPSRGASPRPALDERAAALARYREETSRLDDTSGISGRVSSAKGSVEGAVVCALPLRDGRLSLAGDPRCASTERDGDYHLEALPAGTYNVTANAEGFAPATYRSPIGSDLVLGPGQRRAGVDVMLGGPGVEVRGVVHDALGGVIDGALLFLDGAGATAIARSDARGEFRAWIHQGAFVLEAHAEGYAPGSLESAAPSPPLEIHLAPESVLSGRVVDTSTGAGTAGARVEAGPVDGAGVEAGTTSGPDGRFRIAGLLPGRYRPTARLQGGYGVIAGSIALGIGETSAEVTIRLRASAAVVGRIFDVKTEAACVGGQVHLAHAGAQRRYTASANGEGIVVFEGVAPGIYGVMVLCEGSLPGIDYPPVEVAIDDARVHRWPVNAGTSLEGLVVDEAGRAIAGALVHVSPAHSEEAFRSPVRVAADRDGSFVATGLAAGAYVVRAEAPGYVSGQPQEARITDHAAAPPVRLVLRAGLELLGKVTYDDGEPAAGLQVQASDEHQGERLAVADASGTFRLTGLGEGLVRIAIFRSGGARLSIVLQGRPRQEALEIRVARGSPAVSLVVMRPTSTIAGRVIDEAGAGVPDVWITFRVEERDRLVGTEAWAIDPSSRRIATDEDGAFVLRDLVRGRYTIDASRPGGARATLRRVEVGQTVTLRLATARTMSGRVVVEGGGAPPVEFQIEARNALGERRLEPFFATDGEWMLSGLTAGDHTVSAYSAKGSDTQRVTVPTDRDVGGVVLRISTSDIIGRVVDGDGNGPIKGCRVVARSSRGGTWFGVDPSNVANVTSADGTFHLDGVPAGRLQLWIQPEADACRAYGSIMARVEAQPAKPTTVADLRLRRQPTDSPERGVIGFRAAVDGELVLRVVEIAAGGPADRAGLRLGDVIQAIGDHDIVATGLHDPSLLVVRPGVAVRLRLERGEVVVVVAKRSR